MKMLSGLLPPTEGTSTLFGEKMDANDIELRLRVGYMSQAFSLYSELTVRQNLELHARLYRLPSRKIRTARRGGGGSLRFERGHGRVARRPAAGHSSASLARGGDDPCPRDADPGRADIGRRSRRARQVLANPRRPLPEGQRHDLHLDPLHERGGALRPHFAHERGQGAGQRHAEEHRSDAASGDARRRVHQLPRGRYRPKAWDATAPSRRPRNAARRTAKLWLQADFSARVGWPPTWCARRSNSAATTCAWAWPCSAASSCCL